MSYPGGKGASGVVQAIINQQPPHDTYIEPFLGGGSVMKAKRPAAINIGIDIDGRVIDGFGVAGSGVQLQCANAMRYLRDRHLLTPWTGRELIYCDPPYLFSARKRWKKIYRFEMDDNAHANLLQTLRGLPCMVQISGYESPMYSAHLSGWRLLKFQASTRHGMATECLWMNYPEPEELHDYRYLGTDFREREKIRKKAGRWLSRLNALPRLERLAIYAELRSTIAKSSDAAGPKLLDPAEIDQRPTSGKLALRAERRRASPNLAGLPGPLSAETQVHQ